MKKSYIILALAASLLLLMGVFVLLNMLGKSNSSNQNTNPNQTNFPVTSTGSGNSNGNSNNSSLMTISSSNGVQMTVPDFIHNGTTIEDPANAGSFYLVGSSGACKSDGTCPKAGTSTDYTIVYYPSDGSFIIALSTEPLGSIRKEAEQSLEKTLGLSQSQMFGLKYSVMTTTYVSQAYGGENLGFSFCPGAVALP